MNITQLITCSVIFMLFIVLQCQHQAHEFKMGRPISHFGKSLLYGIFCAAVGLAFVYGRWDQRFWYWQVPLLASFERLAFFDPILNKARNIRPWYYIGRGTTGSLQSKILGRFSDAWVRIFRYAFIGLWAASVVVIVWYHLKYEG